MTCLASSPRMVVVASSAFDTHEISKRDLRRLYLGYLSFYGGRRVRLTQLSGQNLEIFLKEYLNVGLKDYQGRWWSKVFSGKADFPRSFKVPEELALFIRGHDRSLGFLPYELAIGEEGLRVITVCP